MTELGREKADGNFYRYFTINANLIVGVQNVNVQATEMVDVM